MGNREKVKSGRKKYYRTLNNQKSIDNRPKNANERSEPGHLEMDTVDGAKSVLEALDCLEKSLGTSNFKRLFLTIMTDNGSDFSDAIGLETSVNEHIKRTTVYYAHL
ncbi:MAG: hypothetical protein PQJ46_14865 [Spirochaetales bacterium]|nr:hypothetical protein [Spirochaetales bacterium]